ncbi:unnamed protein product [Spirodela intermedia]|uniref:Uncharacterized protein n=1 Tax=Spirodela intermedia TaxID=51605 RepID=A0A7I8LF40_SPIIN|nr:unnamed protein product [Spirodela intermedia]
MAAKRLRNETDDGDSEMLPGDKRLRSLHCFAKAVRGVLAANEFKHFSIVLEPMIRKVVHEEVERGLFQGVISLQRPPRMQVQAAECTTLMLVFEKPLTLPIFTGSKVEDEEGKPLRVTLVDTSHGGRSLVMLPSPVKVEIVVVDGDFPGEREEWTKEEFEKNIVKERTGKRPLITGDVNFILREGSATIGEINFTDNSSWIRSRQFRIGAKVIGETSGGMRIKEAITDPFMVKDHRGESYKKHYPPARSDEVWRLEKIGKDGVFHKRLQAENINTVHDFLALSFVDPERLRSILGPTMSEKTWEATLAHARTCDMDSSPCLLRRDHRVLPFDPVCELRGVLVNGHPQPIHSLGSPRRAYMRHLVQEAHRHGRDPREANGVIGRVALWQQGAMVPQIGYDSSSSPSTTFLPTCQETPMTPANLAGGFDGETIHGNLELEYAAGWIPDLAADQNNHGFFDDC